jgi:hypothetical protein
MKDEGRRSNALPAAVPIGGSVSIGIQGGQFTIVPLIAASQLALQALEFVKQLVIRQLCSRRAAAEEMRVAEYLVHTFHRRPVLVGS